MTNGQRTTASPAVEKKARRYLLKGFLWGFGILAVPTLLFSGMMIVTGLLGHGGSPEMPGGGLGVGIGSVLLALGMGVAIGTGVIGMLIGYIVHRKACLSPLGPAWPGC